MEASDREVATVSFGALAKAQESLGNYVHSKNVSLPPKTRLRGCHDAEALERKAGKKDVREFSRSSKHAPAEVSSKKAVSRKREVIPTPKLDFRDPRFEPTSGPLDGTRIKKNYAFLDTYRDDEITSLKSAIRTTKDTHDKDKFKHILTSMESRKKTEEAREHQQEIVRRHRKEEKRKVEWGKKPFYLKQGDQKKLALTERYASMKSSQVDKVIERRRKKQTAKERRAMPEGRRA